MILQDFLLSGLISIGDEDKRLEWLDAAATALAKDFRKHKRKIANAVLVALDENLPETEPVFEEVEAIVLIHWKALRGMYPDRPRNILRAVILAALDKLRDDATACSISWLIGGSYLPHSHLGSGRQQWHNATKLLRQGSGGKDFNVRKMLAKAKLDFPLNDKLDALDRYARDTHI